MGSFARDTFSLLGCLMNSYLFCVGVFEVYCGSTYTMNIEHPGATWQEAKARCEEMGKRLAVLNTRAKQEEALR